MMSTAQRLLRESIAGHKLKRDSKEEARKGVRSDQCPLCGLYLEKHRIFSHHCPRCVVFGKTGYHYCHGTPWKDLLHAWERWMSFAEGDDEEPAAWLAYQKAADAEIAFLESLLTEEEVKHE